MKKLVGAVKAIIPFVICVNVIGAAIVMGAFAVWQQERRERRAA